MNLHIFSLVWPHHKKIQKNHFDFQPTLFKINSWSKRFLLHFVLVKIFHFLCNFTLPFKNCETTFISKQKKGYRNLPTFLWLLPSSAQLNPISTQSKAEVFLISVSPATHPPGIVKIVELLCSPERLLYEKVSNILKAVEVLRV